MLPQGNHGEQEPLLWPRLKNFHDGVAEADQGHSAGFLAGVGNGAVGPINILGAQRGDVGLCPAQAPEELIKGPSFGIVFPRQDL